MKYHIEWTPHFEGRLWRAFVNGKYSGCVVRVRDGMYQVSIKGMTRRYCSTMREAGLSATARINNVWPHQVPR